MRQKLDSSNTTQFHREIFTIECLFTVWPLTSIVFQWANKFGQCKRSLIANLPLMISASVPRQIAQAMKQDWCDCHAFTLKEYYLIFEYLRYSNINWWPFWQLMRETSIRKSSLSCCAHLTHIRMQKQPCKSVVTLVSMRGVPLTLMTRAHYQTTIPCVLWALFEL